MSASILVRAGCAQLQRAACRPDRAGRRPERSPARALPSAGRRSEPLPPPTSLICSAPRGPFPRAPVLRSEAPGSGGTSNSKSGSHGRPLGGERVKIHEYQAKEILRRYGVATPRGRVTEDPEEAARICEELGGRCVVKAQIHAGGRGKGGGVKLARSP